MALCQEKCAEAKNVSSRVRTTNETEGDMFPSTSGLIVLIWHRPCIRIWLRSLGIRYADDLVDIQKSRDLQKAIFVSSLSTAKEELDETRGSESECVSVR